MRYLCHYKACFSRSLVYAFCLASLIGGLVLPALAADDPQARAIMEKVDAREDGDNMVSDMKMVLIDKNQQTRERVMRSFSQDRGDDTYRDQGAANSWGDSLGTPGTGAALSKLHNEPGELISLILTDADGSVYRTGAFLRADFDRTGVVDVLDLALFGDAWGTNPGDTDWDQPCNLDLTEMFGEQVIDVLDLAVFGDSWMKVK